MQEPGEVVNVIDSFDDGDIFDLNISLGFEYSSKSAKILRETSIAAPGLTTGGFTSHLLNVANYGETMARLTPRIDIGLYKDVAAHISLPVILSNARSLSSIGGTMPIAAATAGAPGETLFSVPFNAPTRSGLEHIAAGFDFNILNQARDRTKPTWLFGFEGRFSVGSPMHACNPATMSAALPGGCADPSDINRNGKSDGVNEGGVPGQAFDARKAGVSRGTMALEIHSIVSKRIKYVEPYGGFTALLEFQQSSKDASDYGITNLTQTLVNHPPLVGTMILGMMIHPWENREKYGRLTFDMRFTGQYHSEGRDYSELFDALGSSSASSMRQPSWASYMANPTQTTTGMPWSIIDQGSQKTYVTGLSDVLAYGSYRASGSVLWQASEYVKFQFGVGYKHDQGHAITADAPCNPGDRSDPNKSGPCHSGDAPTGQPPNSTGLPNPNYRPSVNAVGRRYWVDNSNTFDLFASAVVMF
jgi:hypothetical protein